MRRLLKLFFMESMILRVPFLAGEEEGEEEAGGSAFT